MLAQTRRRRTGKLLQTAAECSFCQVARAKDRTPKIYSGRYYLAFPANSALTHGHTLVIPRRHRETLFELSGPERRSLAQALAETARRLSVLSRQFTVSLNHGPLAGQHVKHLHFHVIPRYRTGRGPLAAGVAWGYDAPRTSVSPSDMIRLARRLSRSLRPARHRSSPAHASDQGDPLRRTKIGRRRRVG